MLLTHTYVCTLNVYVFYVDMLYNIAAVRTYALVWHLFIATLPARHAVRLGPLCFPGSFREWREEGVLGTCALSLIAYNLRQPVHF